MPKRSLLLVDSDARSLRVLEVSLKKAGYTVATATNPAGAFAIALENLPDLVITDTAFPDGDGYDLCERIKAEPRLARCGVVFLTADGSADARVKGINAGADDHLIKPMVVMMIVSRVRSLLERKETEAITRRERPGNLSGALANMGVVDLLQLMESGQKSGIVYLASDAVRSGGYVAEGEQRGTIFFRDGRVIDAHLQKLVGPAAVYRMLMWEDGVFEIEFKPLAREDVVHTTTQALLLEGMRRIDEWTRLRDVLPAFETKLTVDFGALGTRHKDVPDDVRPMLHLFDGRRSILEVVNEAAMDDITVLATVAELHRASVLRAGASSSPSTATTQASSAPAPSSPDIETWLSAMPRSPTSSELPSALGRAMIPSSNTASEIMRAASPLEPIGNEPAGTTDAPIPLTRPVRERTPMPEPVADDSLILSRHTVPANKPVLLTTPSQKPSEPIPLTQPSRTPQRLAIQRVSSVVAARPRSGSQIGSGAAMQALAAQTPAESWSPVAVTAPPVQTDTLPPSGAWAESARKLQLDETERVIRRPAATMPPVESKSSDTGERVPVRSSFVVATPVSATASTAAAAVTAPPAQAAPPAVTNGNTHHSQPAIQAITTAPIEALPRRSKEESGLHESFFQKEEDVSWESQGRWKGYALFGLVVIAAVGALLASGIGSSKKHAATDEPPAKVAKKQSGWPVTDQAKVEVEERPAAVQPVSANAAQPATAQPATETVPAQPATAQPAQQQPVQAAAVQQPAQPAVQQPAQQQPVQAAAVQQPAAKPEDKQRVDDKMKPVLGAPQTAAGLKSDEPGRSSRPAGDATASLAAAEAALKGDKLMVADKNFRAAIEAAPNNAIAHSGLAMVLYSMEKDAQASASAKKALTLDGNSARAYLVLGLVASNKQDIASAKKNYSKYLELEPKGAYAAEVRRFMQAQQ